VIRGIDHIVIPVRDLDTAIADYANLGFTVVRGGVHSGFNTHNALIAFADGSYFELIGFLGSPSGWARWCHEALQQGGGLTDFCVQSDDLEQDAAAFSRAGASISAPFAMSRERPDGYRISWELAGNESDTRGRVPFFIRDITPRDERVPRERTHTNGAAGVKTLAIVDADLKSIRVIYERALGRSGQLAERADLKADGVSFALGPHELQLLQPHDGSGVAAERLRIRGPSPLEVRLHGCSTKVELDKSRAHGARIVLE
jgi:catechol 2,3-dioxygenase-like lactoylglutathione lyase family enzyme